MNAKENTEFSDLFFYYLIGCDSPFVCRACRLYKSPTLGIIIAFDNWKWIYIVPGPFCIFTETCYQNFVGYLKKTKPFLKIFHDNFF